MTFPQKLNLNSFVKEPVTNGFAQTPNGTGHCSDTTNSEHGSVESAIKCDDCSTTDSGSVLEEEIGNGGNLIASKGYGDGQDDDEGIDMTASTEAKPLENESGPFVYELFSIMIHSGSASGGHYYAYIKEFENDQWYCFNDQSVSNVISLNKGLTCSWSAFNWFFCCIYRSQAKILKSHSEVDIQCGHTIRVRTVPAQTPTC